MNWSSLCLTLGLVQYLVAHVDSASPRLINVGSFNESDSSNLSGEEKRSNITETQGKNYLATKKDKDKDDVIDEPSYFPAYLKPLFQTKSELQIGLHRIEDAEIALEELKDQISQLYHRTNQLGAKYETLTSYIGCGIIDPTTGSLFRSEVTVAYYQNKCYIASDSASSLLSLQPTASYTAARQYCMALGGDLAKPSLQQGSDFGSVIANVFQASTDTKYWIFGSNIGSITPDIMTTGGGFLIPSKFFRYLKVALFPFIMDPILPDYGLVVAGPFSAIENIWYLDLESVVTQLPYICEFRAVFDPTLAGGNIHFNFAHSHADYQLPLKSNIETTSDVEFKETLKNAQQIETSPSGEKNVANLDNFETVSLHGNKDDTNSMTQIKQTENAKNHEDFIIPQIDESIANSRIFEGVGGTLEIAENIPLTSGNVNNVNNFENIGYDNNKEDLNANQKFEQVKDDQNTGAFISKTDESVSNSEIYGGIRETLVNVDKIENIPLISDYVDNVNEKFENNSSSINQDNVHSNIKFKDVQKPQDIIVPTNPENIVNSETFIPATIMKQLEHISELRKNYNQKQAVPEKYMPTIAAETKDILPITDQNHPEETVLANLNEESEMKIEKEKPIDYVTSNSFSQDDIGGAADTPTQKDQYEPKFTGETTFESNKEVADKNAKTDDLEPRQLDETKKKLLLEDILAKLEQLEQLG